MEPDGDLRRHVPLVTMEQESRQVESLFGP